MKKSILFSLVFLVLTGSTAYAMEHTKNEGFKTGGVFAKNEDIAPLFADALGVIAYKNDFFDFSPIRDIDYKNWQKNFLENLKKIGPVDIPITSLDERARVNDEEVSWHNGSYLWFEQHILPHLPKWYNHVVVRAYEALTQKAIEENFDNKKFSQELRAVEVLLKENFTLFYLDNKVEDREVELYLPVSLNKIMYSARFLYSRHVDQKMRALEKEFNDRIFAGALLTESLIKEKADINKKFTYNGVLLDLFKGEQHHE